MIQNKLANDKKSFNFSCLFVSVLVLILAAGCATGTNERNKPKPEKPDSTETSAIKTMYRPDPQVPVPGAMYPRVVKVNPNAESAETLLVTFEHYVNGPPSLPIYRSTDGGESWSLFSEVRDKKNNYGMRFQPHLFTLPTDVGTLQAGTILGAGNSIPADLSSTELLLFKSTDGGETWTFMSSIVKGGKAIYDPNGSYSPVWEPFLGLTKAENLICYYSDEGFKQQGYNQLLAHKISTDGGQTWGSKTKDVAIPDGRTRPGMPVVSKLPDGRFMMVYEVVGLPNVPVYYRYSNDGKDWGDPANLGTKISNTAGNFLSGTPYVRWVPNGGQKGTIIVSGRAVINPSGSRYGGGIMINQQMGQGDWKLINAPISYDVNPFSGGYSQTFLFINEGKKLLQLVPVPVFDDYSAIKYTSVLFDSLIQP